MRAHDPSTRVRVPINGGTRVKLRTRVTKGAAANKAALAMACKPLDAAQQRWRRFNGHELVADVLAGAKFKDGERVTDDESNEEAMTDERVAA